MRTLLFLLAVTVAAGTALFAAEIEAETGYDVREIVLGGGILATAIFVSSLLLVGSRAEFVRVVRTFAAGIVFAVVLVTGYNHRFELLSVVHRMTGDMVQRPGTLRANAEPDGDKAVRIRRRPDGHFIARAEVEGLVLAMLIDTGASTVVLKPADAQKLGIDVDRLRFTVPVQTANGTTYAASVRIRSLTVGPIQVQDIDALVSKPGTLKDSLLGMTFLNRLRSYEFSGEFLTLRI